MSLRVRILPEAEADFVEAFVWYEETQRGLGDRFLAAVREALDFAGQYPDASRPVHEGVRRILTSSFPYALLYAVEEEQLVVLGCFHARRAPTAWKIRGRRYEA